MSKNILYLLVASMAICFFLPLESLAQKKKKVLRDTLDNALDISYYLNNLNGFLPVVAPITEPAIGYGAAVAGLFFLPKKDTNSKKFKMPDVVGAAGGMTSNLTWFAGAGYAGFWKDDRIRYRGALGYADVNLTYYGNNEISNAEYSAEFELKTYFLLQQAIFRIGKSHFLLGGKYQLMKNTAVFSKDFQLPGIDSSDKKLLNSGIGLIAEYEHFDNLFSPTKGIRINFTYTQYLQLLGSDRDFGRFLFFLLYYQPIIKNKWIAGFRIESQFATGNVPFYMLPFINLRGVPFLRYQGEITALAETEQEVMITKRWSVVGFGGYGLTWKTINDNINQSSAWNAGAGFRYLISRLFGLKMGIDIARGPEDWAFYVVVGSAWMK